MKKIITAIGEPKLNQEISVIEDICVIDKDIFYKEGIIEFLEENREIDIVVLNEDLCKDNLIQFLSEIIKFDVEIFLLLNNYSNHYREEFEDLNQVRVFCSEEEIIAEFDKSKKTNSIEKKYEFKKNKRIISVLGSNGVGKTVITSIIGRELSKNNRVLIIDFDIFSNNLSFLFNLKNQIKSYNLENLIEKVNKHLYVLNGIKYIFNETNKIDTYKVKELLDKLKSDFDYIIIDTSSELSLKYIKTIIPNCDYNLFIIEGNLMEIKKAKSLIDVYVYDFELNLRKTGLIINKMNFETIDFDIIKEIFKNLKIVAKIKYNQKFNSYINSYTKNMMKIDGINKIQKVLEGKNNE